MSPTLSMIERARELADLSILSGSSTSSEAATRERNRLDYSPTSSQLDRFRATGSFKPESSSDADPVEVAQQLLDELPGPNLAIVVGLIALGVWFWGDRS